MNLPTVIVLAVVLALVVIALVALRRGKGRCSCGSDCNTTDPISGCANCAANCPLKHR